MLFFYIPGYSSENGDGWRFLDLESGELSFWYAGPEILGASISPDGSQVAYSQGDSIFISDIARQTITPLVTGITDNPSGNERTPTWSPTGDRIAYYFNHLDRTKVELRVVDLAGNLEASHEVYNTQQPPPTWSPDGTKVVCISDGSN
ncbi:MAG: PD40 domain-containing protein, partial [Verrucomicrobiae bacterium]|nr:PD40 domain-containing protein [Verrucomicrobiae bacterium]